MMIYTYLLIFIFCIHNRLHELNEYLEQAGTPDKAHCIFSAKVCTIFRKVFFLISELMYIHLNSF